MNITRIDFIKAYDLRPVHTVDEIQNIVMGPSYGLAVLKDPRIMFREKL